MCALRYYVKKTLTNAMNSRMWVEDILSLVAAHVRNKELRYRKLIGSCLEVISYLLKNL